MLLFCKYAVKEPLTLATLPKKSKTRKRPKTFGEKEVDFSTFLPMPEGLEKLFILLYAIIIPYVTGLIFIFIFVARGRFNEFLSLDLAMFMALWAIGYEVVGSIALFIIFYKMLRFKHEEDERASRRQRRIGGDSNLYEVHDLSK